MEETQLQLYLSTYDFQSITLAAPQSSRRDGEIELAALGDTDRWRRRGDVGQHHPHLAHRSMLGREKREKNKGGREEDMRYIKCFKISGGLVCR